MAVSDSVSSFVILEDEKEEGSVRELLRYHVEKRARLHVKAQSVSGIVRVRVGTIVVLGITADRRTTRTNNYTAKF